MHIYSNAVVSPKAELGQDVTVGPFCVVEHGVVIGDRCRIESHAVIKEGTTLGCDNRIGEGAVLGGRPQHLHAGKEVGPLAIGDRNTIREYVTIHRSLRADEQTVVGDDNLMMINTHIGHDCVVGSNTIMANNVMIAGHCIVQDHAYLAGAVAIHQFCRIGCHAMVGGMARVLKDVPPFVTLDGDSSQIVGLNTIGLRRKGFSEQQLAQLKAAYRIVFRSGAKWEDALAQLQRQHPEGPAATLHAFLSSTRRGCLRERRMPRAATIKLYHGDEATSPPQFRRAG